MNLHNGVNVRLAAEEWRQAQTKVQRKEIFDEHGVWYSSLHKLHYRDQVQHTVLGMMHNLIEVSFSIIHVSNGALVSSLLRMIQQQRITLQPPATPTGNKLNIDMICFMMSCQSGC